MNSTIKLPSGKLIDLSRFVALLPAENKYQLSLDGANTMMGEREGEKVAPSF